MTKELKIPEELNEGQSAAWRAIEAFVRDEDDNVMILLEGYAGTGKTYVMTKLISALVTDKAVRSVAMTAPTNKAVKVLRKMSKELKQKGVEFITVHKLLGVKEQINDDGTITFEPDKLAQDGPNISEYDLVVVDEVSMLHDELYKELMLHAGHVKIVFTGDPAQIPPVGLVDSIPLVEETRIRDGVGRVVLSEIMRQKEGNPIIEIASMVRENLAESYVDLPDSDMKDTAGHGVLYLGMSEQAERDRLTSLLREYFCSQEFVEDADHAKVLAWRNVTVGSFNNIIRSMIYADQMPETGKLPKIMHGEKLIANSPIVADFNMIIYSTNEEFVVVDYQVRTKTVATDGEAVRLSYYKIETVGEFGAKKRIDVLHEDSEEDFKRVAADMKAAAIRSRGANRAWPKYYQFLRSFADVAYNYSLTCHKCQGSTYRNVFVAEDDLNMNRNIRERNRIKYTAFTRASEKLYRIKR
jgi:exodeoxyribonuclease V